MQEGDVGGVVEFGGAEGGGDDVVGAIGGFEEHYGVDV